MLKAIEDQGKKLGAFARASLAADLTEEAIVARNNENWLRAFTLLHSALTLQPKRSEARRHLANVKGGAPESASLSVKNLDANTIEHVQKLIKKSLTKHGGAIERAFKGSKARRAPKERNFTLSLVFAALFILIVAGYNIIIGVIGAVQGHFAMLFLVLVGSLLLVGGYFLMKQRLLGLTICAVAGLYMFISFCVFLSNSTVEDARAIRHMFLLGCLPSIFLLITLAINTPRIIRRSKNKSVKRED